MEEQGKSEVEVKEVPEDTPLAVIWSGGAAVRPVSLEAMYLSAILAELQAQRSPTLAKSPEEEGTTHIKEVKEPDNPQARDKRRRS